MSNFINTSIEIKKCINNSKEFYTGLEDSPLGLGYSPSIENYGKIMYGLDGNLWFVDKKEKQKGFLSNKMIEYKIWSEYNLNFDSLPEDCYNEALLPIVKKSLVESGLENKFGGDVPFFIEGETWPLDCDGVPMTFCCQFRDPQKNNNKLYRIFIPFEVDFVDYSYDSNIKIIELNDNILKKQIIIKKPNSDKLYDCFQIEKWKKIKELKTIRYIKERLSIPEDSLIDDFFHKKYYDHRLTPTAETKVGGTPIYCQYVPKEMPHLIQLVECKFIPYTIGDAGIIHIDQECKVYYDCY